MSVDVLAGDATEPGAEDLQIERIHRELAGLSPRDRQVVEEMVSSLKRASTS